MLHYGMDTLPWLYINYVTMNVSAKTQVKLVQSTDIFPREIIKLSSLQPDQHAVIHSTLQAQAYLIRLHNKQG